MTKKVYHRCVICGSAFLQVAKTISRHLQVHQLTLQDYYEQVSAGCLGFFPHFALQYCISWTSYFTPALS